MDLEEGHTSYSRADGNWPGRMLVARPQAQTAALDITQLMREAAVHPGPAYIVLERLDSNDSARVVPVGAVGFSAVVRIWSQSRRPRLAH